MMRILGIILLVGSVLLIGINIVRFSSSTVARARDEQSGGYGHQAAVLEVSDGVSRTVKFIVIPATLLLIGGVLINNTRRDDRVHELHVKTGEETLN
jgi:hypothetical protein